MAPAANPLHCALGRRRQRQRQRRSPRRRRQRRLCYSWTRTCAIRDRCETSRVVERCSVPYTLCELLVPSLSHPLQSAACVSAISRLSLLFRHDTCQEQLSSHTVRPGVVVTAYTCLLQQKAGGNSRSELYLASCTDFPAWAGAGAGADTNRKLGSALGERLEATRIDWLWWW